MHKKGVELKQNEKLHLPASRLGSPLSKYSGAIILTSWENRATNGKREIRTRD